MKKKIMLIGALGLLLSGCASAQTQTRPGSLPAGARTQVLVPAQTVKGREPAGRYTAGYCKAKECDFVVTVKDDCVVDLDPQWMAVERANAPKLVFKLKADNSYKFAANPIVNKPDSKPPNIVNDFTVVSKSDKEFTLYDSNTIAGTYQYGIIVVGPKGACPVLDPPIINDM
jgi:hypothetical protein